LPEEFDLKGKVAIVTGFITGQSIVFDGGYSVT